MSEYTPYQKTVIKRFYEHRETLAVNKLAETVSNLYLETSPKKQAQAWERAYTHMVAAGVKESEANVIVDDRDLDALAKIVGDLS